MYFGDVSADGAFTGTGSNFFEGTLNVDNSPRLLIFLGDRLLASLGCYYYGF